MVDKELLSRKLSQLREYLVALRNAEDITWKKYEGDLRARAFVERYLQLCIEKVIDIGNHFVSFHRWREPEGYRCRVGGVRSWDLNSTILCHYRWG